MSVKLFISYAREDEAYKEQLEKRLKPYVRNQTIEAWNDRAIEPGSEWDDEIKAAMEATDIIIFLVSADFIASDYIHDVEIAKAIERYEQGTLKIVPVILRPSDLSQLKITKFQALPKDALPITKWDDPDEAWLNVIEGLKRIFDKKETKVEPIPDEGTKTTPADTNLAEEVRNLISQAKVDKAIDVLSNAAEALDADINNQVILLSGRFQKLKKDELLGIISNDEAQRSRAQINYSLLSLLDSM